MRFPLVQVAGRHFRPWGKLGYFSCIHVAETSCNDISPSDTVNLPPHSRQVMVQVLSVALNSILSVGCAAKTIIAWQLLAGHGTTFVSIKGLEAVPKPHGQ